jgi:hypothetical protein
MWPLLLPMKVRPLLRYLYSSRILDGISSVRSDIQGHTPEGYQKFPSGYRSLYLSPTTNIYGAGLFFAFGIYKDLAPTEPSFSRLLDHGQQDKRCCILSLAGKKTIGVNKQHSLLAFRLSCQDFIGFQTFSQAANRATQPGNRSRGR